MLLAGLPTPAPDARPTRDAKAGVAAGAADPRVVLLVAEAYRHGKPLGSRADAQDVLATAGVPGGAAGVVVGDDPAAVFADVLELLGAHRVWDRFPASL